MSALMGLLRWRSGHPGSKKGRTPIDQRRAKRKAERQARRTNRKG